MPSVAASHATLHPGPAQAGFVIGDHGGTRASSALFGALCEVLRVLTAWRGTVDPLLLRA